MNVVDIIIRRRLCKVIKIAPGLLFQSDDDSPITLTFDNHTGWTTPINFQVSYDLGKTWSSTTVLNPGQSTTCTGTQILVRGVNPNGLANTSGSDCFHIYTNRPTSIIGNMQYLLDYNDPDTTVMAGPLGGVFNNPDIKGTGSTDPDFPKSPAHYFTNIDELVCPWTSNIQPYAFTWMFAGDAIRHVPSTLFACLNDPSYTVVEQSTFENTFTMCKQIKSVDLNFYNIVEVKQNGFHDFLAGAVKIESLVYDAFKNVKIAGVSAFQSVHGSNGWIDNVQDFPSGYITIRRGYDMPNLTSIDTSAYLQYVVELPSINYIKCLQDNRQSINNNRYYQLTNNKLHQDEVVKNGVFVKHLNANWPVNTAYYSNITTRMYGIPMGWKVVSYNPALNQYCIADNGSDTTWHADKLCDEYGNLI